MPLLPKCALFLGLFLFPALPVSAAVITFSTPPEPLGIDLDFPLTVTLQDCNGCGDSFIRGVFYLSGSNYFGLTENDSGEWVGTDPDKTHYFGISSFELSEGSWTGEIRFRADSASSYYQGPGSYNFKIGRYTPSGSLSVWSESVNVNIVAVGPTPTVLPLPTPPPDPDPTPTVAPTPDPTPTPAPGPVPTSFPPPVLIPALPKFPVFRPDFFSDALPFPPHFSDHLPVLPSLPDFHNDFHLPEFPHFKFPGFL